VAGWHGFIALHGLTGDCGCKSDLEEHRHYVPNNDIANGCDSSGPQKGCWGGDNYGLAISPQGDVWAGDEHFVALLPQGSSGPSTGLNDTQFQVGIDVFPDVPDEVRGLAVDSAGGVWVASNGNGLAYLEPNTLKPMYWSSDTTLPLDYLQGAVLDRQGDLWVGTNGGGVARYHAADNQWIYYTQATGLASDRINAVYADQYSGKTRIFFATENGFTIFNGE
jgi:ligand-binding sensor domain-containing protein